MYGLTLGSTHSSVLTCVRNLPVTQRTCIWKVLTSTVVGSCFPDDLHRDERQSAVSSGTDLTALPWMVRVARCRNPIGNTVSPQDVMNKLGADILRLWVASTDYTGEMAVSDEILNVLPTAIVVSEHRALPAGKPERF